MNSYLIKNTQIVNEGKTFQGDILIKNGRIEKIANQIDSKGAITEINGEHQFLLPGVIDDQVHFREPGLTHKGELYTEAKAAVAGGCTTYMEMPNTIPSATTIELLEQKYTRASEVSLANYSFYMGTTNTNLNELLRIDESAVCGVKIFMGSSTGDMLVDDPQALENIFSRVKTLIATHCEYDPLIKENTAKFKAEFGENLSAKQHPLIRSREACYQSSSFAVALAKKYNTRLHVLHISTKEELDLFENNIPLSEKKITCEACIHHLWFSDEDYATKGNYIKWNPAVKTAEDRDAIWKAVNDGRVDVIATDHAPHTIAEKEQTYINAPSGGPLIQHTLQAMIECYLQGKITLENVVQKMCHNPAILFDIDRRGFIREGFWADLVIVDMNNPQTVSKENILYKCNWSPFEGYTFKTSIDATIVSGHLTYQNGVFNESKKGERLRFIR